MNCPKCGTDSQNAKFCPECGQNLRQRTAEQTFEEKRKALQASGQMYCPNCLSTSYTVKSYSRPYRSRTRASSWLTVLIDIVGYSTLITQRRAMGRKCECAKCGYQWFSNEQPITEKYREHISGILDGNTGMNFPAPDGGYLQLSIEGIIVFDNRMRNRAILFEEITDVQYWKNVGPCYGWLSIRHTGNRKKPFPKSFQEAKKDKTTVFFDYRYTNAFYELYSALRAIMEENKKAGRI